MQTETSNDITKPIDVFRNSCDELLTRIGFVKENDIYIKNIKVQQPRTTMVINGVKMEQPGEIQDITLKIEFQGRGEILSDEGDVEDVFDVVTFKTYNDYEPLKYMSDSFYPNEYPKFERILQHL